MFSSGPNSKKVIFTCIWGIFILLNGPRAYAQSSDVAQRTFSEVEVVLQGPDLNAKKAERLLEKCIDTELATNTPDNAFLAKCHLRLADLHSDLNTEGNKKYRNLWKSAVYTYRDSEIEQTGLILQDVAQHIEYMTDSNYRFDPFGIPATEGKKDYQYVGIRTVRKLGVDSFEIVINAGSALGLTAGQRGGILTASTKFHKERGNKVFGSLEIIQVSPSFAKCIAIRDPKIMVGLLAGDNAWVQLNIPDRIHKGLLYELASLNIYFKNRYRRDFYHPLQVRLVDDPSDENIFYDVMLSDVIATANSLYDPNDNSDTLQRTIKSGRFEGLNMWEAMLSSTTSDIRAFFRFVSKYPAKYMGRSFRLDETYATWIINNSPSSDYYNDDATNNEAKYLMRDYREFGAKDFSNWAKTNKYYLSHAKFLQSSITQEVNDYLAKHKYDTCHKFLDQFGSFAKEVNDTALLSAIAYGSGHYYAAKNDPQTAIEHYTDALNLGVDVLNAHWWRAGQYEKVGSFGNARKDLEIVIEGAPLYAAGYGTLGWTLLKMGKFKEADPYCRKAHYMDSTEMAWTVNLGHCHLLLGRDDSARMYYKKTLGKINYEAGFKEGIIADFELFMENGWKEDAVLRHMAFAEQEWNRHYLYKARAKEYYNKGLEARNNEKHELACRHFDSAINNVLKGDHVNYGRLRHYERFAGTSYFSLKNYERSVNHYRNAWKLSSDRLRDLDDQLVDLRDIRVVYQYMEDELAAGMYQQLHHFVDRRIDENEGSNNLYVVAIGKNDYDGGSYSFAESDAKELSVLLERVGKTVFDTVYSSTFVGNSADPTEIRRVIQKIKRESRYGDCFIFYFGGYSRDGELLMGDHSIATWEIYDWLHTVRAQKQFILLDAPDCRLIHELNAKDAAFNPGESKRDLNILTNNGSRIEIGDDKHGLLSKWILKAISGDAVRGTNSIDLSAKKMESYIFAAIRDRNEPLQLNTYSSGLDFNIARFPGITRTSKDTIPPRIELNQSSFTYDTRGGKSTTVEQEPVIEGRILDESPIDLVEVNGVRTRIAANGRFAVKVPMAILDDVRIKVRDVAGNESFSRFDLTSRQYMSGSSLAEDKAGQNYAVLFATDEYDEWSDLNNPINDAEEIGSLLERFYGFEVKIVKNPTKDEMEKVLLNYLTKEYSPKDQLFLFFAGHGINDKTLAGQLVCADTKLKDKQSLPTYVPFSFITDNFDRNNCKHVFLAFDVCFGGAYFDQTFAPKYMDSNIERIGVDQFIQRKLKYKSRQFLTSGTDEYVPDGTPGGHSPFAGKFIETLRNGRDKGYLTLVDFVDHMRLISTEVNYGTFGSHHRDGEFVFRYSDDARVVKQASGSFEIN